MSSSVTVRVIQPGFLSTVQDLGRTGYQAFGVPESGAMDKEAAMIANMLTGNHENSPVIEVTVMGLELEFSDSVQIAITGGNLRPVIDGRPAEMYQTITINAYSRLSFTGVQSGARAYIGFAGHLLIDPVMGSCSTYLRGNFGGYQGRKLQKDDVLQIKTKHVQEKQVSCRIIPDYQRSECRVLLFREQEAFSGKGISSFLAGEYEISNQSDRMGFRLEGPAIAHRKGPDIISAAISFGAIQIPGHGQPIIMMADRQTVGGYTQIGCVISVDLPLLAQSLPGKKISFKEVSLREAQELYRQRYQSVRNAITKLHS